MATLNDLLVRLGFLRPAAPKPEPAAPTSAPSQKAVVTAPASSADFLAPPPAAPFGVSSGQTTVQKPAALPTPKPAAGPSVLKPLLDTAGSALRQAGKATVSQVLPPSVSALLPEGLKTKAGDAFASFAGQTAAAPAKAAVQFALSPEVSRNVLGVTRKDPSAPVVPRSELGRLLFGEEIKPYTSSVREEAGKFQASPGVGTGFGLAAASVGPILDLFPGLGGEEKAAAAAARLPKALAGAKPAYSFGAKRFIPEFASDLDKAAFILAQGKKSARDADYLAWAMKVTGLDEPALRSYGLKVKEGIKGMARDAEDGTSLKVPSFLEDVGIAGKKAKTAAGAAEDAVAEEVRPGRASAGTSPETGMPPAGTQGIEGSGKSPLTRPQGIAGGETILPGDKDAYGTILPQKEIFYNWDKLDIPEAAKEAGKKELEAMRSQVERTVGKPLTQKEVLKTVEEAGSYRAKAVGREETAAEIANEHLIRQKLGQMAESGKADDEYVQLLLADLSYKTDVARKLNALRMTASPKDVRSIDTLIDAVRRSGAATEEIVDAARGKDLNDPRQAEEFYRKFVKPKLGDWLDLVRYNSMLSSPLTHLYNITSNALGTAGAAPVEYALTGALDAMRSAVTGKPREAFAGEAAKYAKGVVGSVPEAAKELWDTLRGKKALEIPERAGQPNFPLATSKAGKALESVLTVPTRLLETADAFFQTLAKSGETERLAYRAQKRGKALDEKTLGLIGDEAKRYADKRLLRGELGKKANPEQGVVLDAIDSLALWVDKARKNENPIVRNLAKLSVPFLVTPTNVAKQMVEYSPLGFATVAGAGNKTEQLAKAVMGTSAGIGIATLASSGRLTWGEPADAKRKQAWRAAGIQPYSVKVGDKWYSFQRLHPALSVPLALVASVNDAVQNGRADEPTAEAVLSGLSKSWQFIMDQAYLKSVGDLVAGAQGDAERLQKLGSNYASQFIPFRALLSWSNNLIDRTQRLPKSDRKGVAKAVDLEMQWIMSQLPGLSKIVPARTDRNGNPIMKPDPVFNAFSPVRRSTEDPEKAAEVRRYDELTREFAPLKDEAKAIKADQDAETKALYERLSSLPPEQANAEAEAMDDEQFSRLKAYKSALDKGGAATAESDALSRLGVDNGIRSRKVWEMLDGLPTPEAKNAKIEELKAAGVITKGVEDQLYARKALSDLDRLPTPEEKNAYVDTLDDATYEALAKIIKLERKNVR